LHDGQLANAPGDQLYLFAILSRVTAAGMGRVCAKEKKGGGKNLSACRGRGALRIFVSSALRSCSLLQQVRARERKGGRGRAPGRLAIHYLRSAPARSGRRKKKDHGVVGRSLTHCNPLFSSPSRIRPPLREKGRENVSRQKGRRCVLESSAFLRPFFFSNFLHAQRGKKGGKYQTGNVQGQKRGGGGVT